MVLESANQSLRKVELEQNVSSTQNLDSTSTSSTGTDEPINLPGSESNTLSDATSISDNGTEEWKKQYSQGNYYILATKYTDVHLFMRASYLVHVILLKNFLVYIIWLLANFLQIYHYYITS